MRWFRLAAAVIVALVVSSPATAADQEVGKKVYVDKCASCHGADGKGNAKMAETLKVKIGDLSQSAKSGGEMLQLVSQGKTPMPAFGKRLSKEEMEAVVEYAKGLGKGAK